MAGCYGEDRFNYLKTVPSYVLDAPGLLSRKEIQVKCGIASFAWLIDTRVGRVSVA